MKVAPQMRDQLGVARMVSGLDADDLRREGTVVLVQVSEEVELGLGRTDEKDLTVFLQCTGDLAKVFVLVVGMVPDAQIDLLGVAMDVRAG